ncbi:hypothetical protein F5Y07DRAFT_364230 [Xylaria sp. FL0933]|nr:hypothetical protein F5Y07DRAFT_364230 [Xylaria sp. FL0933]
MGCSGSKEDYYDSDRKAYRPSDEKPHYAGDRHQPERRQQQHHQHRQHYEPRHHYERQNYYQHQRRDPSREEAEKRRRQAQATAAAQNYGWPTTRGMTGNTDPLKTRGNRDSVIEPDLAGGLAAMPGSDFRAVYDPQRAQQQRMHRPSPPRPPQRPPYYQQRFVEKQPARMPNMPNMQNVSRKPQVVNQNRPLARKPVIQTVHPQHQAPRAARIVRRDSNGVSECSDDDVDIEDLRDYTVSPILPSPPPNGSGRRNAPF